MVCHISLESSQQGLQLCFKPHFNRSFSQNLMGFQSCGSPNFGNFKTPSLGIPKQNDIWVQGLWPGTKNTIRGMVASLKLRCGESCESVFARGSSMHQKCSYYALNNLLFSLCKFVWIIDSLVTCLSPHPRALASPSTPEMLWTKEHTPTPYPSIVFTLDS